MGKNSIGNVEAKELVCMTHGQGIILKTVELPFFLISDVVISYQIDYREYTVHRKLV